MILERIFKYELPLEASLGQRGYVPVIVTKNSVFLSIGVQNDKPVFWCRHSIEDEDKFQEVMKFMLVQTGDTFEASKDWENKEEEFVGSLLMYEDGYVVHVFRKR